MTRVIVDTSVVSYLVKGHSLALGYFTHNPRHFRSVDGLDVITIPVG